MYIIADSGSTKTQWCAVGTAGDAVSYYTSGINAVMMTREQIMSVLTDEYTGPREGVDAVYFYGAGCGPSFADATAVLVSAVSEFFGCGKVEATTDLMAAARALCGKEPGIACILGTGANSCYYDGEEIVKNVRPLGFILGDEGSGAVMGKKLLANVLKGIFPEDLCNMSAAKPFHGEHDTLPVEAHRPRGVLETGRGFVCRVRRAQCPAVSAGQGVPDSLCRQHSILFQTSAGKGPRKIRIASGTYFAGPDGGSGRISPSKQVESFKIRISLCPNLSKLPSSRRSTTIWNR